MRAARLLICVLACVLALQLAAPGWAATDLRIQLNPALAALHERDPAKAAEVLDALERIIEQGPPAATAPATRSIEDPAYRALIEGNPLLEEAWRIDPKAALDQLRDIVAAGGE